MPRVGPPPDPRAIDVFGGQGLTTVPGPWIVGPQGRRPAGGPIPRASLYAAALSSDYVSAGRWFAVCSRELIRILETPSNHPLLGRHPQHGFFHSASLSS